MPLNLRRAEGDTVVFRLPDGREILLVVGEARRGRAFLKIEAPEDVVIFRKELREQYSLPR